MKTFPTIEALAAASEESVILAWEGLGYYSRARALHAAAKRIVDQYGGVVPKDNEQLRSLPGIGPYTAGAILAFAFHERAAAVDANVRRVVRRLLGGETFNDVTVEGLLPVRRPWETMEALIELGALVCKPVPLCDECPLMGRCRAYATQTQGNIERRPAPRTKLWRDVVILVHEDQFFVSLKGGKEVMSGLYEFPYYESTQGGRPLDQLAAWIEPIIQTSLCPLGSLPRTTHAFTRFFATLYPSVLRCQKRPGLKGTWVTLQEALKLPFSSGHKRVLHAFRDRSATFAYL